MSIPLMTTVVPTTNHDTAMGTILRGKAAPVKSQGPHQKTSKIKGKPKHNLGKPEGGGGCDFALAVPPGLGPLRRSPSTATRKPIVTKVVIQHLHKSNHGSYNKHHHSFTR